MKKIFKITFLYFLLLNKSIFNAPLPIEFCIPESKFISQINQEKTKDFASIVPGQLNTYIFNNEEDYYNEYKNSYFAITQLKGGWDCLRHYEILANGCIPYFLNLENCPENTMFFLPKKLILEAMNLSGVSKGKIDHKKFNKKAYYEILQKIFNHSKNYLTTKNMASYLLKKINYSGEGKILFLARFGEDYQKDLILIGLKEILKDKLIDIPKNHYLYKNYLGNTKHLYGKGFTYTKNLDDFITDRENIEERIKNKEFELIIYGSVHRGFFYNELVKKYYTKNKIIYICGEDLHKCPYANLPNFFLREYDAFSEQKLLSTQYLYQW